MVTPRNKRLMKMEAALSVWVQDCRKKSIALDTNTIRTKAQQLYNRLANTEGGDADEGNADEGAGDSEDPQPSTSSASSAPATFTASKGWFEKFQLRYGLKSVSLHGEAAQKKKLRQQLTITMFVTKTKRSVTPSPAASIIEMVIEEDPELS
ncbi:tigger transposable element-derived protein 1-like [Erythrolamprus reginae]|uniref:tigger transposable element-derived protein 1-like n=1 Tax=Erythrolamprus reginae TaxID=121349 RepID=UPI00396C7E7D